MDSNDSIISFSFMALQMLGVLIAIIGGLIATKILDNNNKLNELKEKAKDLEKKIEFDKKYIIKVHKELLCIYQENEYISIIQNIFRENDDFDLKEYENKYITIKEREKFFNFVKNQIRELLKEKQRTNNSFEDILKGKKLEKSDIKYKILDFSIEFYSDILEEVANGK